MTEESTLTLAPWDQLRSLAEEDGKSTHEILNQVPEDWRALIQSVRVQADRTQALE